jgi:hypothetical protein
VYDEISCKKDHRQIDNNLVILRHIARILSVKFGMDSMVNFTPRVQQVLILAKQEAERSGHQFVGTEHVLAAVSTIQQCIAVSILCSMNVDARQVWLILEKQLANTKINNIKNSEPKVGQKSTKRRVLPASLIIKCHFLLSKSKMTIVKPRGLTLVANTSFSHHCF